MNKRRMLFLGLLVSMVLAANAWAGVKKIVSGYYVNAVITEEGGLWTWGANSSYLVNQRVTPYPIGTDVDWVDVGIGEEHMVAVKRDGSLWAWGANSHGQLGDGTFTSKLIPTRIGTATDWAIVKAGSFHTLALKRDGSLWAWGWNSYGELGDGTAIDRNTPVRIGTGTDWAALGAGYSYSLAIKKDGSLWAWGFNQSGQLGDGTTTNRSVPTRIGTDTGWVKADAMFYDHTLALKTDGSLWLWGYGVILQSGAMSNSKIPVRVGSETDWAAIGGGKRITFAVKKNGSAWTISSTNLLTQVGTATEWIAIADNAAYQANTSRYLFGVKRDGSLWSLGVDWYGGTPSGGPEEIRLTLFDDTERFQEIAAGGENTLAVATHGQLWAWGRNNMGQLGDGTVSDAPSPVRVGVDAGWAKLAGGGTHTLALKADGSLYAWGNNYYGQLGGGMANPRYVPGRIGTDTDWAAIAAGQNHSLALRTDGSLWAWGDWVPPSHNGGNQPILFPNQIGFGQDWAVIASGGYHSIALKRDGSLWTWGNNDYGQLGDGTISSTAAPTRIADTDWAAMAGGGAYSVALKTDGSLWAWGDNFFGQLGNGTGTSQSMPTRIGSDTDWLTVAAGEAHTVALKRDGSLWAWGDNSAGQLGDGTTILRTTPVRIGTDTDWAVIKAGTNHTVALKQDGTVWTWGDNSRYQQGDGKMTANLTPSRLGAHAGVFYYCDSDHDGSLNMLNDGVCDGVSCPPAGCALTPGDDCNDFDANEHPNQVWYKDLDGDGYSDGTQVSSCARPAGYKLAVELTGMLDCDDTNAAANPGLVEIVDDGIDNNCNGFIDTLDPTLIACTGNGQCGAGYFCKTPAGMCSGSGYCQPIPSGCEQITEPVCGCDAATYANACEAERKRVNIMAAGTCIKERYYFPSIKDDDAIGWENYLTVQAKEPVAMEVTVRVYDMAGNLKGTYIYSDTNPAANAAAIAPNARVAQRPSWIAGSMAAPVAVEGSMIVETSVPAIASTNCIANFYQGFSIYESARPRQIHNFPKAFDGPDNYQVYMLVQNIHAEPRSVTVKLFGKTAGDPGHGATKTVTIPAFGTLKIRPSEVAPLDSVTGNPINFNGSVVVYSNDSSPGDGLGLALPAMCRYEAGAEALAIYESTVAQPALHFPVIKDGKFGGPLDYQNFVSVVNPSTTTAAVTTTRLYNKAGVEEALLASDVIPAGGKKTWRPGWIKGSITAPADFEGSIVVTSNIPVVGQTNTIYPGSNIYGADAFDLFESAIPAPSLIFPKAFDNLLGTGTGATHLTDNFVSIQNPEATARNVTIELYNNNGTLNRTTTITIAPHATHTFRPKDLVTDGTAAFRGSVKITESTGLPVAGAIKYEIHKTTAATSGIEALTIYRSMGQ